MDLGQLLRDSAEGLGETGLQSGVKLLVYRDAHLFEFDRVVLVKFGETFFNGEP